MWVSSLFIDFVTVIFTTSPRTPVVPLLVSRLIFTTLYIAFMLHNSDVFARRGHSHLLALP